jgi:hypothetical protein
VEWQRFAYGQHDALLHRRGGDAVSDLFGGVSVIDTGERNAFDYYPTPDWMTRSLLEFHPTIAGAFVLEPCSGDGAIVRVLEAAGCVVITNDVVQRHPAQTHMDATDPAFWSSLPYVEWVITNPPFNVAFPILQHAFKTAQVGVALLLRKTFLEPTEERGPWLAEHPPARLIGQPRYSFRGKGSDSVSCDWCVWLKHPGTWYEPIVIDASARSRCGLRGDPVGLKGQGDD